MPDWQEEILFQWVSQSYQFLPTFRKYIFIISFTFDYSFCNWDLGTVWITALPGTGCYTAANHFFYQLLRAKYDFSLMNVNIREIAPSSIFRIFTPDLITISSFISRLNVFFLMNIILLGIIQISFTYFLYFIYTLHFTIFYTNCSHHNIHK